MKNCRCRCRECEDGHSPARAGFIKIALEKTWAETPQAALEGTALAARETGALVEIHTEKGALAEKAVVYFEERGIAPQRLVLCHMDKRPDHALQMALASYGPLLEYDTFYRPKYDPGSKLWPLIVQNGAGRLERACGPGDRYGRSRDVQRHWKRAGVSQPARRYQDPPGKAWAYQENQSNRCWAEISPAAWLG